LQHGVKWLQIELLKAFRSQLSKHAFSILIAVALVSVLVFQIEFDRLIVDKISWVYFFPIFFLICCSYVPKTSFFSRTLQKEDLDFRGLFFLTAVYSWVSVVFPLGLGHFSYPYLLQKQQGIKLSRGVSSLIAYNAIRALILTAITLWSFFSLDFLFPDLSIGLDWGIIAIGASILAGVIILGASRRGVILEKAGLVGVFFRNVISSLQAILVSGGIVSLLFFALVTDLFNLTTFYFAFLFAGLPLSITGAALVFGLANLSVLLPIHGIGCFGSLEAIFTVILIGLGQTANEAIQVSFVVHIVQLANRTVIGLACYAFLKKLSSKSSACGMQG